MMNNELSYFSLSSAFNVASFSIPVANANSAFKCSISDFKWLIVK